MAKIFIVSQLTWVFVKSVRAVGGRDHDGAQLTHTIPNCAKNLVSQVYVNHDCIHHLCVCANDAAVAEIASLSRHACIQDEFFGTIRYLEAVCGNVGVRLSKINMNIRNVNVGAASVYALESHQTRRTPNPSPNGSAPDSRISDTGTYPPPSSLDGNIGFMIILPVLVAGVLLAYYFSYLKNRHLPRPPPYLPPPPLGSHAITLTVYTMPDTAERDRLEGIAKVSIKLQAAHIYSSVGGGANHSTSTDSQTTCMTGKASYKSSFSSQESLLELPHKNATPDTSSTKNTAEP